MQVSLPQRPLSKAQSSQHGLRRVLGEGNLASAPLLTSKRRPSVAPPGSQALTAQENCPGLTALLLWFPASLPVAFCAIGTCSLVSEPRMPAQNSSVTEQCDRAADPFPMWPCKQERTVMHLQRTVSNSLSLKPAKDRDLELPATL